MYLKISLRPLSPYFFGGERNEWFENSRSQLSEKKPYFIRSNRMLSQTAAFGVLRFLGIKHPEASFKLTLDDKTNIGEHSFHLLKKDDSYGRIRKISPVMLEDRDSLLIAAPRNRLLSEGTFIPFDKFIAIQSGADGSERCIPIQYKEKDASMDPFEFLCNLGASEKPEMRKSVFSSQIKVGINRMEQKKSRESSREDSDQTLGFFKKEYILLDSNYKFVFYADVEDEFFFHERKTVYVGKGRMPFSARTEKISEETFDLSCLPEKIDFVSKCIPDRITLNNHEGVCRGAFCISDLFYDGDVDELVKSSSFAIAYPKESRAFITNYRTDAATERFKKEQSFKLIPAGSVFLFIGKDENEASQKEDAFKQLLDNKQIQKHAMKAGFNCIHYT